MSFFSSLVSFVHDIGTSTYSCLSHISDYCTSSVYKLCCFDYLFSRVRPLSPSSYPAPPGYTYVDYAKDCQKLPSKPNLPLLKSSKNELSVSERVELELLRAQFKYAQSVIKDSHIKLAQVNLEVKFHKKLVSHLFGGVLPPFYKEAVKEAWEVVKSAHLEQLDEANRSSAPALDNSKIQVVIEVSSDLKSRPLVFQLYHQFPKSLKEVCQSSVYPNSLSFDYEASAKKAISASKFSSKYSKLIDVQKRLKYTLTVKN